MRNHCLITLIVAFLLVSLSAKAQILTQKLDQVTQQFVDYNQFGGVVLVAQKDRIIYQKSFGLANRSWNIPNTLDTRFQIGSVTKPFTAILALQQVARGKLALQGKVSDYLPNYPQKTGRQITIHHLLSHTSGLVHYNDFPNYRRTILNKAYTTGGYLSVFKDSTLKFKPGAQFDYSSFGYYLLGVILEKVTQKSYAQLLQEYIFSPTNMTHSSLDNGQVKAKQAIAYRYNFNWGEYGYPAYRHYSTAFSTGGIFTTAGDLFKFQRYLMQGKFLPSNLQKMLFKVVKGNYAYGWLVENVTMGTQAMPLYWHDGGITGYTANLRILPKDQSCIIVLSNTRGYKSVRLPDYLLQTLYKQPVQMKASLWKQLYPVVYNQGAKAAIALYRQLKTTSAEKYAFDNEREYRLIGHRLLRNAKTKDAQAIFQFNLNTFPQSANMHEDLGYYYRTLNKRGKAIEFYKKAMAIEPNERRKEQLNRLLQVKPK
ncbi:MAG TPA: hypothetical protein DCS93_43220 [Microscillaceae bacterium]|nr:hypothetical protein [Microscillaceae bacterium]